MLLPFICAFLFGALNIFLWSLELSQEKLFAITLPLGGAYFWGIFRIYRNPD